LQSSAGNPWILRNSKFLYYHPMRASKLNPIQWFFIVFCAGAERDIIEDCRTEWQKYTSLGATVLFTGLLAWVSCGYALYSVFQSFHAAMIFGFLWGLVIFNLDRFIIVTLKKLDDKPFEKYGPFSGIFRISTEFFCALPRIVLALIIAITIAKPLEVKIFEDRLRDAIVQSKHDAIDKHKEQIEKRYRINDTAENEALEAKINKIEAELKSAEDPPLVKNHLRGKLKEAEEALAKSKSKKAGNDLAIQQIEVPDSIPNTQRNKLIEEGKRLQYAVNSAQREVDKMKKDIDAMKYEYYKNKYEELESTKLELKEAKTDGASTQGIAKAEIEAMVQETGKSFSNTFVTQLEALGELSENDTMKRISMMLTLLFFAMELAPIFAKLISKRGPYDERIDSIEYEYKIQQRKTREIDVLAVDAEQRIYRKKLEEWEESEASKITKEPTV